MVLSDFTTGFLALTLLLVLALLFILTLVQFIFGLTRLWKAKEKGIFWLTLILGLVTSPFMSLYLLGWIRTIQKKQWLWLAGIILLAFPLTSIYFLINPFTKKRRGKR